MALVSGQVVRFPVHCLAKLFDAYAHATSFNFSTVPRLVRSSAPQPPGESAETQIRLGRLCPTSSHPIQHSTQLVEIEFQQRGKASHLS
jgi:hypothetical protein